MVFGGWSASQPGALEDFEEGFQRFKHHFLQNSSERKRFFGEANFGRAELSCPLGATFP